MIKTFKAWAISDVINGERTLVINHPAEGQYSDLYESRKVARYELKYRVLSKPKVERVKITVETE